MRSEVVRVDQLKPGDVVTETDTPCGPYYRVADLTASSLVIDPGDVLVELPFDRRALVRRAFEEDASQQERRG